jgi:hypothetical protein
VSTLSEDMRIAEANERLRRAREKEQNQLAWARYYNQLAKSHAMTARRYEELADELLETGGTT